MTEIIVSCAGCGKRFKGVPSPKKFKCSGCSNIFTFPEVLRIPAENKALCSNCWQESNLHEGLCGCATCMQKISPAFGGKAQLWAAGSSLAPSITSDDHPRPAAKSGDPAQLADMREQLEAAKHAYVQIENELSLVREEHMRHVEQLRVDLRAAHCEADHRNQEWVTTRTELDQYKAMAVATLEPLGLDYTRRMRELISETDKLRSSIREVRQDYSQRLTSLEQSTTEMRDKLNTTCREINERLADVLGVEPDRGEVLTDPVLQLPDGPLAELIVAGALSGSPLVVTRHPR